LADWVAKLDDFIRMTDRQILTHAGKITHETAKLKAEIEYEKYRTTLPESVDQHFSEAVDELKKIENASKKRNPRRGKNNGDT
jgi:hypothetical protein